MSSPRDGRMAGAYNNLAILEERLELRVAAETHYRRAIALKEQFPDAHFNLGMLLLRLGRFPEGFSECEWRWQTSRFTPFQVPHPLWDGRRLGRDPAGPQRARGGGCHPVRALPPHRGRAMRSPDLLLPREPVLAVSIAPWSGRTARAGDVQVSEFHAYLPLMSLPHVLGTTLKTIPCRVPYLQPDRRSIDLGPSPIPNPRLKVGLAWSGSPTHLNDRHRSCRLRDFGPLLDVPDVAFYSLQVGPRAGEVREPGDRIGHRGRPERPPGRLRRYGRGDRAARFDDRVDTSVLHLAGALGRPGLGNALGPERLAMADRSRG